MDANMLTLQEMVARNHTDVKDVIRLMEDGEALYLSTEHKNYGSGEEYR